MATTSFSSSAVYTVLSVTVKCIASSLTDMVGFDTAKSAICVRRCFRSCQLMYGCLVCPLILRSFSRCTSHLGAFVPFPLAAGLLQKMQRPFAACRFCQEFILLFYTKFYFFNSRHFQQFDVTMNSCLQNQH